MGLIVQLMSLLFGGGKNLVRETAELIKGSKFHLMRGAGHLPMAEKPEEYATILTDFLDQIGHISL